MSQQSGSTQSCSEASSNESGSVPPNKPKSEFGKKHRKLVRILTVIAYMISVSTAAVLLSAYYVFLWNPTSAESTEPPASLAMARTANTHSPHHYASHSYSSFALPASHIDVRSSVVNAKQKTRRNYKYHALPTPQGLVMANNNDETTHHQLSKRSTGQPPAWLPTASSSSSSSSLVASTTTSANLESTTQASHITKHPAYIIKALSPPTTTNKTNSPPTTKPTAL